MPCIWSTVHHQPTPGEHEEQGDEPEPGSRRGEGRREASADGARSCAEAISAQAAHENSDVESPVLPSYSMPKALMRERLPLPS